jgi:hypothetical protein
MDIVVPIVLGRCRVFPPLLLDPAIHVGHDPAVVFRVDYGPATISEIRIQGTLVSCIVEVPLNAWPCSDGTPAEPVSPVKRR